MTQGRGTADALRDCDGTEFPEAFAAIGAKGYATCYTTRKHNAWAEKFEREAGYPFRPEYIVTYFAATGKYTLYFS